MGAGIGWAWGMGWARGMENQVPKVSPSRTRAVHRSVYYYQSNNLNTKKVLSSNSVAISILHAQTIIDRYTHYTPKNTQSHNTQELFSNPVYGYEMILLSHLALSNIQIRPLSSAKHGICTLQTNLGWNFSPCI